MDCRSLPLSQNHYFFYKHTALFYIHFNCFYKLLVPPEIHFSTFALAHISCWSEICSKVREALIPAPSSSASAVRASRSTRSYTCTSWCCNRCWCWIDFWSCNWCGYWFERLPEMFYLESCSSPCQICLILAPARPPNPLLPHLPPPPHPQELL